MMLRCTPSRLDVRPHAAAKGRLCDLQRARFKFLGAVFALGCAGRQVYRNPGMCRPPCRDLAKQYEKKLEQLKREEELIREEQRELAESLPRDDPDAAKGLVRAPEVAPPCRPLPAPQLCDPAKHTMHSTCRKLLLDAQHRHSERIFMAIACLTSDPRPEMFLVAAMFSGLPGTMRATLHNGLNCSMPLHWSPRNICTRRQQHCRTQTYAADPATSRQLAVGLC